MEPSLHRRKSSKDGGEEVVSENISQPSEQTGHHARGQSSPLHSSHTPPLSAGFNRTSFSFPRSPNGLSNGTNGVHTPPFRSSFSHGRSPSMSGSFQPSNSSPLSSAFPPQQHSPTSPSRASPMTTSVSAPEQGVQDPPARQNRRHARVHSRNLSVFFPRPGALSHATISEDGSQEIEFQQEAPVTTIPSGNGVDARAPLGVGFKFGTKAPNGAMGGLPPLSPSVKKTTSRRGHHHKHSLSHNFFSFLEPGSQPPPPSEVERSTASNPESPFVPNNLSHPAKTNGHPVLHSPVAATASFGAQISALGQFLLGAWVWVAGQQRGSLSTTGLGYWVVFDSFAVAVSQMLPPYLARFEMKDRHRRSYGNARIETVALFSCAIYLMFSAVYVCKEAVEHVLLSAGGEGHHHHGDGGDDSEGVEFPVFLLLATLLSLTATSLSFQPHSKMAHTVGNYLPSPKTLMHKIFSASNRMSQSTPSTPPTGAVASLLSNPYSLSPLFFSSAILCAAIFLPSTQQRMADLLLAFTVAVVTSRVAYQASVVLGVVLLQTSPSRGLPGGATEAFLRTMREVERHPQVFHLPAPRVWQLTPSEYSTSSLRKGTVVVTMELHVRDDLSDDDVLTLTKWTHEKVVTALRSRQSGDGWEHDEAEVTIGVVRG